MSPSSPPPFPPSPLQSVSLLWSVCKLDSLFESAASFRISSLASPFLLSLPLSPELAHGVLRPRTPPLMGLYSNFGLWFSPGFPLARETSQGNGGSKRVRAGLEEGQRFPTLQQPPTRMEIAFRLIPTERSNLPSPLATRSTFSYPPLPPTFLPRLPRLGKAEECRILIYVKLKLHSSICIA